MTCGTCRGHKERSVKCLLDALETIKQHALMMQRDSEESVKTIENLKAHNEKMHKALELLKERQETQPEKRRKLSPKKQKDDISPLPQSQNSLNMNIALNSIELSDEDQEMEEDESITETETNSMQSPRKMRLLPNRKPDIRNLENVQPNSESTTKHSWIRKTPKNPATFTKLSLTHKGSPALSLKQTRLKFEANKTSASDKDVIEDSPNVSSSSRSHPPRSLMQSQVCRTDTVTASSADDSKLAASSSKIPKPTFELEEDAEFTMDSSELPLMPPPTTPPFLRINNTSDSVVLLTPGTQDIIFVNDTPEEVGKLGTMDVLAEIMKDDDDSCSNALRQYEKKMIDQQKHNKPNPPPLPITRPVKAEPISQPAEPADLGNESTKLPEDIERYMMDIKDEDESKDSLEEEEEFPRPIVVKKEPELSLKERYNINCADCEKFINFMGSNLTEEKIKDYLNNCRHVDARSSTPPGFWNPHMVSFAEDDPRNEVLIDNRFRDQRLSK